MYSQTNFFGSMIFINRVEAVEITMKKIPTKNITLKMVVFLLSISQLKLKQRNVKNHLNLEIEINE